MYKEEDKAYIYKLTSPSGRNYIGQTISLKRRLGSYRALRCKQQPKIYNALLKYGFDSFTFEILATVDKIDENFKEILNDLEIKYIEKFEGVTKGYNLTTGGGVCEFSNETKTKMSLAKKGKKQTPEHIAKAVGQVSSLDGDLWVINVADLKIVDKDL
jgi:group I intron endonuclease